MLRIWELHDWFSFLVVGCLVSENNLRSKRSSGAKGNEYIASRLEEVNFCINSEASDRYTALWLIELTLK